MPYFLLSQIVDQTLLLFSQSVLSSIQTVILFTPGRGRGARELGIHSILVVKLLT
jgi:hypothetical protein